jgi:3-oxoacyl-[acyl-carrier protein] reductase
LAYSSAKAALLNYMKNLSRQVAADGIRVNAVAPGYLQTPMSEAIDSPAFVRDFVDRYIPIGRYGKVEDVAPLFVFLAGDASSFVTGQVFVVDGGQLAGQKASPELLGRLYPHADRS